MLAVVGAAALVLANKGHAHTRRRCRESLQGHGERYCEQQDYAEKQSRHRRRFYKLHDGFYRRAPNRSTMASTARICAPSLVAYFAPVYPHQSQQPRGL